MDEYPSDRPASDSGPVETSNISQSSVPIPKSIDLDSHPHILSSILDYASPATLAALLQCSQHIYQAAVGRLYRNLRLRLPQLAEMIETGWAPAKRGPCGRLDGSFSCYLRLALTQVRTLHLLDYGSDAVIPDIPDGCLTGVKNIVLYPTLAALGHDITLPPTLRCPTPTHLYVRVPEAYSVQSDVPIIRFSAPPSWARHITVLIPLACRLPRAPSLAAPESSKVGSGSDAPKFSVILLPWDQAEEEEYRKTIEGRWEENQSSLAGFSDDYAVSLVGGEYAGVLGSQKRWVVDCAMDEGATARHLSISTFGDWFDQLEPDSIFTFEEDQDLWYQDLQLVRRTVADYRARFGIISDERGPAFEAMELEFRAELESKRVRTEAEEEELLERIERANQEQDEIEALVRAIEEGPLTLRKRAESRYPGILERRKKRLAEEAVAVASHREGVPPT